MQEDGWVGRIETPLITRNGTAMKIYLRLTSSLVFLLSSVTFQANANIAYSCGLKPLPRAGCVIGDCVNGVWQQVCSIKKDAPQGYSDSLLHDIANPKTADIAGALEIRKAREEREARAAEELHSKDHLESDKPTKKTVNMYAAFADLAKVDMSTALLIMTSYGNAFSVANGALKIRKDVPLFCPTVDLSPEDLFNIYQITYKEGKDGYDMFFPDFDPSLPLLHGLRKKFPCTKD